MGRRLGRRAARADQRRMQPRVVATNADEVVVLYQQRGLNPQGESDRSPVLALYEVRDHTLIRAQISTSAPQPCSASIHRQPSGAADGGRG